MIWLVFSLAFLAWYLTLLLWAQRQPGTPDALEAVLLSLPISGFVVSGLVYLLRETSLSEMIAPEALQLGLPLAAGLLVIGMVSLFLRLRTQKHRAAMAAMVRAARDRYNNADS